MKGFLRITKIEETWKATYYKKTYIGFNGKNKKSSIEEVTAKNFSELMKSVGEKDWIAKINKN